MGPRTGSANTIKSHSNLPAGVWFLSLAMLINAPTKSAATIAPAMMTMTSHPVGMSGFTLSVPASINNYFPIPRRGVHSQLENPVAVSAPRAWLATFLWAV